MSSEYRVKRVLPVEIEFSNYWEAIILYGRAFNVPANGQSGPTGVGHQARIALSRKAKGSTECCQAVLAETRCSVSWQNNRCSEMVCVTSRGTY
jgi:hypothetical protein